MSNLPNFPTIRPSLLLDFANSQQVDPRISFTRASTATYFDAQGVLRTAASGVPRIDHDPVTGECKGLIPEEARTNLLTYSEQFDNAAWNKFGTSVVSANAISAPNGTVSADLISNCAGYSNRLSNLTAVTISGGGTYTFSVYVRSSGSGSEAVLQLATFGGTYKTVTVVKSLAQEWKRLDIQITTNSDNTGLFVIIYGGDGTSGLYLWGAQLEAGASPTSYIPTTSAAATRAAEVASMTGANFSEWYRQDEGTFVVTASRAATGRAFTVSDGTANENMRVNLSAASPLRPDWQVIANGTTQVATTSTPNVPLNSNFTVAASYKKDDFAISVNGAAVVTDTSGTVPLVDRMHLAAPESGVATGGAHFRRIAYYPKRLTNAELQALTA